MTDVRCENCKRVMFRRRGNTLIAYGFSFDMKRSHNIKCDCGHGSTMFCVTRDSKPMKTNTKMVE